VEVWRRRARRTVARWCVPCMALAPMSQPGPLLVPLDFSPTSQVLLEFAADMAGRFDARIAPRRTGAAGATAPLHGDGRPRRARPRAALECARSALVERGLSVGTLLRPGDPAREVLRLADVERPLAIVIGSHGHSRSTAPLLGSVSDRVVRYA